MEKSWDVIVWHEENLIDYVPSSWGNETKTKYKYPTSTNSLKIRKSVDTCTPLTENFHWLEAICKAEAVKDLNMAKDLCNKGQYTSNLETADEQTATESKRKRKKNRRIYDDNTSSDQSTDEPLSNLIHSKKKSKLNKQSGASGGGLVREKFYEELKKGFNNNVSLTSPWSSASTSKISALNDNNATPTGRAPPRTALFNTSSISKELESVPVSVPLRNTPHQNGLAFSNDSDATLSEICNIKFEIQEIRKILARIDNTITVNAVASISNEETETTTMNNKLPCKTTVDMDNLEAEMASKENFKTLVSILYLVGGNTPHKTVYFMMNKLFGKQLSLKYSGQGKKKKIPFCGLKIYDAIMVATRKRHPSSTEDAIKKSVALFLATAKSRLPKPGPERDNANQEHELDQETD